MAESLVSAFRPAVSQPHPIQEITLIPSGRGRYEVMIDGELVYSKAATGEHTTNEFIIEQVRQRLAR
jgi:predicted Rdx family selenoprotein